ncbi:MAG: hypothetical protein ABI647_14195 [Gemmatimonadota bacterium]
MSGSIPVFIDDRKVEVSAGTTAEAAVRLCDERAAEALALGKAYLTDGRGIRLEPGTVVRAGAIVRVVMASPRG